MKFEVYRGAIEPITDVRKSEIILHDNHLEIIQAYDFMYFDGEDNYPDSIESAYVLPKNAINLIRSSATHMHDPDREEVPCVSIDAAGLSDTIFLRFKRTKDADDLYIKIKNWMLK